LIGRQETPQLTQSWHHLSRHPVYDVNIHAVSHLP